MSSPGSAVAAFAAAVLLASLTSLPAAAASEPDDAGEQQGPPAEAVGVPYLGEAVISPAPPWSVVGCPQPPPDLAITCAADRIALVADSYDPAWGEHLLDVTLGGPAGPLDVRYRVTLDPPEPPAVEPLAYGYPVASGATVLLPLVLLAPACTRCTAGTAQLEVGDLQPAAAGFGVATGTHVVVRTSPGFTGDAVLPVRLVDDAGQPAEFEVALRVGPSTGEPGGALHILVPIAPEGEMTIDLAALAWTPDSPDARFACSEALAGTVSCADSVATYLAATEFVGLDQFAVHVVTADGRLALASVTLVPTDVESPVDPPTDGFALAPVGARATAPLLVTLLPPDDAGDAPASSPLEGFGRVFGNGGLAG